MGCICRVFCEQRKSVHAYFCNQRLGGCVWCVGSDPLAANCQIDVALDSRLNPAALKHACCCLTSSLTFQEQDIQTLKILKLDVWAVG